MTSNGQSPPSQSRKKTGGQHRSRGASSRFGHAAVAGAGVLSLNGGGHTPGGGAAGKHFLQDLTDEDEEDDIEELSLDDDLQHLQQVDDRSNNTHQSPTYHLSSPYPTNTPLDDRSFSSHKQTNKRGPLFFAPFSFLSFLQAEQLLLPSYFLCSQFTSIAIFNCYIV